MCFKNAKDDAEVGSIMQMIADALDCMQQCQDFIEMSELKDGRPFHNAR